MSDYKRLKEKLETILTLPELPFEEDLTAVDCKQMYDILCKIEQGTLIELPCKVGDTVWCLIAQGRLGTIYTTGEAIPRKVNRIILDGHKVEIYTKRLNYYSNGNDNGCNYYGYFDETVFLTKAEAEQRLKELQNER